MPQFPGGLVALSDCLQKNIRQPSLRMCLQGKVFIEFAVKADGTVEDAKVLKGLDAVLDALALEVIQDMPNWIPRKTNNQPVRVKMVLPIRLTFL